MIMVSTQYYRSSRLSQYVQICFNTHTWRITIWDILYHRMSNQSNDINIERSVSILTCVECTYVYSTCRQGYPRTDTSRHIIYTQKYLLRYFYLMDYYLISTGTGISIYTRPMSLAPTIDHISRFNVSRIQKSSRREVKRQDTLGLDFFCKPDASCVLVYVWFSARL